MTEEKSLETEDNVYLNNVCYVLKYYVKYIFLQSPGNLASKMPQKFKTLMVITNLENFFKINEKFPCASRHFNIFNMVCAC